MAATGTGIVADTITTGFLDADRIAARSITVDKLASNVGQELILSSDTAIRQIVQDQIDTMETEDLTLDISNNSPPIQIYDPNAGGGYAPDWTEDHVVLTPVITYAGENLAIGSQGLAVSWTRGTSTLTAYETVSNGVLTISGNFGDITSGDQLVYTCTAVYTPAGESRNIVAKQNVVFSRINNSLSARSVEIGGTQMFHYDSNSDVSPASITLTATTQNVTVSGWKYKNASGNWVAYPGAQASDTLTVLPDDAVFVNDIASIRVVTNGDGVEDECVIVKVRNGQSTPQVWLTNESYVFVADKDGKVSAITVETDLVCYTGDTHEEIIPGDVTIGTLPSGMTVSKTSTNSGDVKLTFAISDGATFGTDSAVSGTVSISLLHPVERTLYFKYTKVIGGANGSPGQDGVGIESIVTYYILSQSSSTPPSGTGATSVLGAFELAMSELGRSDAPPSSYYVTTDEFPYLWSYDVITYTDGTVVTTDKHVVGSKGDAAVNFTVYAPNGTVFQPGGAQTLTVRAVGRKGSYPIPTSGMQYVWEKKIGSGSFTTLQATTYEITVPASEVPSEATYRCTAIFEGSSYQDSVTLIDKTDTIIKSATEPLPPVLDMLWLDTSRADRDVDILKRCTAIDNGVATWEEVTVSSDTIKYIYQTLDTHTATFDVLRDAIESKVTHEQMDAMSSSLEQSILTQTASDVNIAVSRSEKTLSGRINDVQGGITELQNNVNMYFNFSADGLQIGKTATGSSTDSFKLRLTNNRLSFVQDTEEVAYMNDHALYIEDARVTDTLSLGGYNGWFDWIALGNGSMALKWRGGA